MKHFRSSSVFHRGYTRRQLLRAGAISGAGLYALSALGCGQGESKQPAKTEPQTKQPKRGGTLNFAVTFDPQGLDPHTSTATAALDINDYIYGSPMRFKQSLTGYDIEPDLIEKWEQPDDLTYVLYVRKGVKWHNLPPVNGRELTADDIKYTFDRIATNQAKFQRRWMFAEVAKVEVTDKFTVKMSMKRPLVPMLSYLADRFTKVVAREAVEAKGDLEDIFIGTGPFMMKSYDRNVGAKMVRHPDYYVSGKPYGDAMNVPIVKDASARLAALRSRELDFSFINFSDMEALKKNPGDMKFGRIPNANQDCVLGTALRLSTHKPPFDDVRVRKALQMGFDRKKLIATVVDGMGVVTGPIAPYIKDWTLPEAEVSKYLKYDPEGAKKLLAEAGYSSGLKFSCNASVSRRGWPDSAIFLKEQYKAIGVELEVKAMEHSAYVAAQVARSFETMVGATYVDGADPDFVYNVLHSKGPRQFSNYNNPKMDELLEKQRGIFNKEERKKVLLDVQRLALEDVPEVHLFVADGFVAMQPYLNGYEPNLDMAFRHSAEYWIDK